MWRFGGFALALPLLLLNVMGLITMPRQVRHTLQEDKGVINVDALIKEINTLNKQNKSQQSLELLLLALDQQHEDSLLRPLLLQTFDLFLDDEIRKAEQEISQSNKNIGAYLRAASALELLGSRYRALEILINGICVNPQAAELWMKIGKLEHKSGRDWGALDVFKEVIRLDPKNSDAYNNAAFVVTKNEEARPEDLKTALTYALNARKLHPNNPEYIDTLAEIEFRQGHSLQAQNLIKQAIKLAPDRDFYKSQLKRFGQHEVQARP
jgi:tetratricopeptide (TPR) repeat protein